MLRRPLIGGAMAAALALPALAHHDGDVSALGGVIVSHAHTHVVSANAHAIEVYLTIENAGDETVRLTGAEVDFAADGVFQAPTVSDEGVVSIREVSGIDVAPGQIVTFQPGGLHIVFNDVQAGFAAGDDFHAHLQFEGLPAMEIDVEVEDDHDLGGDLS